VRYHGGRHPVAIGAQEVSQFLSSLAEDRGVSASTQNQASSALLFLYREVRAVLKALRGRNRLIGLLLYGTGLRLMECLGLRELAVRISGEPVGRGQEVREGGAKVEDFETRYLPCLSALVRHPSVRERSGHSHGPGAVGASGRLYDNGIHACTEQGCFGHFEPGRPAIELT
jgi:hypothetical protein